MRKDVLKDAPRDYFGRKIAGEQPMHKQNLLAFLLLYLILYIFVPTHYAAGPVPGCVTASKYAWLFLCLVYAVASLLFSVKKGRRDRYAALNMAGMNLLYLELWLILSHFAIVLCCGMGGNRLDPAKANLVFALALALLAVDALIGAAVYRHMKKRVAMGAYRDGGNGFWDNQNRRGKLLRLLGWVAPAGMAISTASLVISRFWRLTWDEAYIPAVAILCPLLVIIIFLPFSYVNAICMLRIYYTRRFGAPSATISDKDEKK